MVILNDALGNGVEARSRTGHPRTKFAKVAKKIKF